MATGGHEDRLRVVCHLPLNNADQEIVLHKVIQLLTQPSSEGSDFEIGGFTMSRLESPVFFGYWWSDLDTAWVKDNVVICYIDYVIDPAKQSVLAAIQLLKNSIEKLYEDYAKRETEIWIVAHPVIRHE